MPETSDRIATGLTNSGDGDFDISTIVAQLRLIREESLASRQRTARPAKLPSRKQLMLAVEGLSSVLFPNRLGSREFIGGNVDYFVGTTLDASLKQLTDQVVRELQFAIPPDSNAEAEAPQAKRIVRSFAALLPKIRAWLETDIRAAYDGDPAARSIDEVLACYPGVTAIVHHRWPMPCIPWAHHW